MVIKINQNFILFSWSKNENKIKFNIKKIHINFTQILFIISNYDENNYQKKY